MGKRIRHAPLRPGYERKPQRVVAMDGVRISQLGTTADHGLTYQWFSFTTNGQELMIRIGSGPEPKVTVYREGRELR